jgi:DegV family protein with EDD domain
MSYVIAVASTADLPREYLDEHGIPFIKYGYSIDGEFYEDDCEEASKQHVYDEMRAGKTLTTTAINPYTYYEFFKAIVEKGDDLIFLDMTQKISSSYFNSLQAVDMVKEEYPSARIVSMDTRCVSGGLGFLVKEMVGRKEEGMSFDDLIKWGDENKLKIAHRFTVDDLNYLRAGGRVSNAAALVGSVFSIKPVLYVPDEGTLEVAAKIRGRKKALAAIIDGVKRDLAEIDTLGARIDINHADCLEEAEYIKAELLKAHPDLGEVNISSLGVVIGAHCGPGLIAIFYFCDKRCS